MVKQAGYHKAAELLFTAKKFNAEAAVQAGLVNEIVEDAYATAQATAQHLTALPLASLKQTKALMKHDLDQIIECIDHEAEIFMQRVQSPEMLEAVQAFMQNVNRTFHSLIKINFYDLNKLKGRLFVRMACL